MNVGKNIRSYRQNLNMSQEDLADKIYVSRQTISNWETEKSYPDVQSLIMLSQCFKISLDQLIEGDLEKMKKIVKQQDVNDMDYYTKRMSWTMLALILIVFPAFYYLGWWGVLVYIPLAILGLYYALQVEKIKDNYDLKTYRQLLAFSQGRTLDDLEVKIETAKYPYQKPLIVFGFTLIFAVLATMVALIYVRFLP
ncbi:transcriptional regulator [Streptococcus acidominimus]|uniref:Transcriptional regulator n=1 Tax=Streptococcus acidominimus TaxID=1326 RepID=A0A239XKP4_STRAI|nr:helix-turn-helix transcriptional regulator [Streptococcus acidominimus]SNV47511.1 transcriptional regulator [Streptococcus acidominimus]